MASSFRLLLVISLLLVIPLPLHAVDIETRIDIFHTEHNLIGVVDGKRTRRIPLRQREEVLWVGAEGHVGAALTTMRFLVLTLRSPGWKQTALRRGEGEASQALVSEYLALLATPERLVGVDARSGSIAQTPIRNEVTTLQIDASVAIAITPRRVYALGARASGFSDHFLRTREVVEAVRISENKALLRTTDRLLIFNARTRSWRSESIR